MLHLAHNNNRIYFIHLINRRGLNKQQQQQALECRLWLMYRFSSVDVFNYCLCFPLYCFVILKSNS